MTKKVKIKRPRPPELPNDADAWVNSRAEVRKRLTFDIPSTLHAKLKIYSVNNNKTMGEVLNELLEDKLKDSR